MTIAFDATSSASQGTGNLTWNHNPVGTPKGVLVLIMNQDDVDQVSGVTYGGTAMVEITGSPLLTDLGEDAAVYAYFLGENVPTDDPAEIVVTVTGNRKKDATAWTVTADGDTEVETFTSKATASEQNPSLNVALNGETCFVAWGGLGGNTNTTELTARSGNTKDGGNNIVDLWLNASVFIHHDTIGSTDVDAGWDNVTANEDAHFIAIAIKDAAAGGDTTLTADPSLLTLTGATAGLTVTMAAVAGSLAFTGAEATLSATDNVTLSADPSELTLTGADANADITMVGDAGTLTFVGSEATLTIATNLTADPGSLVLSGSNAAFTQTQLSDPGALLFTGAEATLDAGGDLTLVADPAALTLSGAIASFVQTLVASPSELTLTGSEADLTQSTVLTADSGTLLFTGADATLFVSGNFTLAADPGILTFAGAVATLFEASPVTLTADPATLLFTGSNATLTVTEPPAVPDAVPTVTYSGKVALDLALPGDIKDPAVDRAILFLHDAVELLSQEVATVIGELKDIKTTETIQQDQVLFYDETVGGWRNKYINQRHLLYGEDVAGVNQHEDVDYAEALVTGSVLTYVTAADGGSNKFISVPTFVSRGYGGIKQTGTPGISDLGAGFQVVPANTTLIIIPADVTQDQANDGIRIEKAGVWSIDAIISLSHNSNGANRNIEAQLYNDTKAVEIETVTVPIKLLTTGTLIPLTFMIEVPEVNEDDLLQIRIGNIDTVTTVVLETYQFSANRISKFVG